MNLGEFLWFPYICVALNIFIFSCLGDPLPKVTWWQSGSLYDSSDEVTRMGVIIKRKVYKGLRREDLGKTFTCQAANTNLTVPVSAEVKIIMTRKYTKFCFMQFMFK